MTLPQLPSDPPAVQPSHAPPIAPWLTLVGIGEDGLAGLGETAREAVLTAPTLFGGARHLALIPPVEGQARHAWPSPFAAALEQLMARRGSPVCVLASGDPLWHGVGSSLAARLERQELRILPAPSSFSLAAARLGWALQDTTCLALHHQPVAVLRRYLAPGVRLLALARDGETPAHAAALLTAAGYGQSLVTVLAYLGGAREAVHTHQAAAWPPEACAKLSVIAIECIAAPTAPRYSRYAGLPDTAFCHDGQLTKQDVRAATLARLAPQPGERLWDIGAGCGSIGIEWLRAHPRCEAIAIEQHASRRVLIDTNRHNLGVPSLQIVAGVAPAALAELPAPDAIFIGGGLTASNLLTICWPALRAGGRLVANAVTLQGECLLFQWQQQYGGELTRLAVSHAASLGQFDGWQASRPVTLWHVVKPA